jgi:tetratricopeptide (TPR) repeat protein
MIVILVFLYFFIVFSVQKEQLVDSDSFISRFISRQQYISAINKLSDDPIIAIKLFEESFALFPTSLVAEKLGWLHSLLQNNFDSNKWFERSNNLENSIVFNLSLLGIKACNDGDFNLAIDLFDRILSLQKQNSNALFHKSLAHQNLGDVETAAKILADCIAVDPLHVKAIINLAVLHHKYGSVATAIDFYLQGLVIFKSICKIEAFKTSFQNEFVILRSNIILAYLSNGNINNVFNLFYIYIFLKT